MGSLTVPGALPEATVHSIPSKTSYSGPARVRSYFQPAVDTEQQKLQAAQVARAPHSRAACGAPRRGLLVMLCPY
jgi:hypothetical protein